MRMHSTVAATGVSLCRRSRISTARPSTSSSNVGSSPFLPAILCDRRRPADQAAGTRWRNAYMVAQRSSASPASTARRDDRGRRRVVICPIEADRPPARTRGRPCGIGPARGAAARSFEVEVWTMAERSKPTRSSATATSSGPIATSWDRAPGASRRRSPRPMSRRAAGRPLPRPDRATREPLITVSFSHDRRRSSTTSTAAASRAGSDDLSRRPCVPTCAGASRRRGARPRVHTPYLRPGQRVEGPGACWRAAIA